MDACKITISETVSEKNKQIKITYRDSQLTDDVQDYYIEKNDLILKTIQRIYFWTTTKTCLIDDLKVLGLHLYYLLFNENIRKKFDELLEKSQNNNPKKLSLRLTLVFEKSARELSMLPWEFIFLPKIDGKIMEGEFATKRTELIITRYLHGAKDSKTLIPEDIPIKILIVSSHPTKLGPVVDGPFLQKLLNFNSGKIHVIHLEDVNRKVLRDFIKGDEIDYKGKRIKGFAPHIFHFIGHGDAGKIALIKTWEDILTENPDAEESEADNSEWLDGEQFSSLFDGVDKPKFVFLNACNVAKIEYKGFDEFSNNIAIDLINHEIPAVLAMQYKISNADASNFAEKIYSDIMDRVPIDQAIKNGIDALGELWFGIPVFYLNAEDTSFITFPDLAKPASPPKNRQIQCWKCDFSFSSRLDECPQCNEQYKLCPNCGECLPKVAKICTQKNCKYPLQDNEGAAIVEENKRQASYQVSDSSENRNFEKGAAGISAGKANWSDPTKKIEINNN